jgi:PadR family transcriptional regulator PadR
MLYPVLHRLAAQGLITSRWRTSESGRKRRYYSLKPRGQAALEEQKEQWMTVHHALAAVWGA